VPTSTVASQPALQWVSTLTGAPLGFLAAIASISLTPWRPIAWLMATSSSAISAARR
jgi:hypothetical protein